MMYTRHLLALITLCLCLSANAQSKRLANEAEVKRAAEGIVAAVAAGNVQGALKELRPLSVIPSTEFDVFEAQVNSQHANLLRQFGESDGYELAREDRVGSRLLRLQYLVFHKNAPIRWVFVFYRATEGWQLSHFAFDGNAMVYVPQLLGAP